MSRNPDFDAVMIKKAELERLHAEIERLRAALQKIADDATPGDDNYCSEIARRALEPKP